jgi:hypothetical protein
LVRFQLEVSFRCDFADVFEVKSGHIIRRGQITTWSERRQRVRNAYSNQDFHRATTSVAHAPSKAVFANGRLSFEVALQSGEAWHSCPRPAQANPDRFLTIVQMIDLQSFAQSRCPDSLWDVCMPSCRSDSSCAPMCPV